MEFLPPPPLVFSIYGGMGRECSTFYNRLAKKIAEKQKLISQLSQIEYELTGFALLKSVLLCLRGARSISRNVCFVGDNKKVAHELIKIWNIV